MSFGTVPTYKMLKLFGQALTIHFGSYTKNMGTYGHHTLQTPENSEWNNPILMLLVSLHCVLNRELASFVANS